MTGRLGELLGVVAFAPAVAMARTPLALVGLESTRMHSVFRQVPGTTGEPDPHKASEEGGPQAALQPVPDLWGPSLNSNDGKACSATMWGQGMKETVP